MVTVPLVTELTSELGLPFLPREGTRPIYYWLSFLSSPGSQGGQVPLLQFQGSEAVA